MATPSVASKNETSLLRGHGASRARGGWSAYAYGFLTRAIWSKDMMLAYELFHIAVHKRLDEVTFGARTARDKHADSITRLYALLHCCAADSYLVHCVLCLTT